MNILLFASSARGHALAEAIKRSQPTPQLFAYLPSRQPGVVDLSEEVLIGDFADLEKIKVFAKNKKIDLAVIGPEAPLSLGVVDALAQIGIPSFGPTKQLAQLETSKSFTRDLMKKYNIFGNPDFKVFNSEEGLAEYAASLKQFVVKADGLHGGKGVKVMGDHFSTVAEGVEFAKECIAADGAVVVEEKLIGQEFSLLCITDGKTVLPCPPCQDHKRAYDDDKGPNTGGMGSYSDADHLLPFLTQADIDQGLEITKKMAAAIYAETGQYYKGVMYGGFMATADGVKLIEYNARFGDPEAENVLPIMTSDFVKMCQHVVNGTLNNFSLTFAHRATVCKYVVPQGYPDAPLKNEPLDVEVVSSDDVKIYFGAVDRQTDGQLIMTGSRAVAVVGLADTIAEAEQKAENAIGKIKGRVFHRADIGTAELIAKRVAQMKELRS